MTRPPGVVRLRRIDAAENADDTDGVEPYTTADKDAVVAWFDAAVPDVAGLLEATVESDDAAEPE